MKKLAPVVVLLLVGVTAGALIHRRWVDGRGAAPPGAVRLHGNVDLRDAQLAFFGTERIAEVLVQEGERVEPGQVLARQETERVSAELAGARARVRAQEAAVERLHNGTRPEEIEKARAEAEAAEARVANAERDLERRRATSESGTTTVQAVEDGLARLEVERATLRVTQQALVLAEQGPRREDREEAEALLEALRADVALLERRLSDAELLAPSGGVVQSRILEPGEMASPERPVLTLALDDPKWVRAWVPEPELARVGNGRKAIVRSDARGGSSYDGWVGFVSPVAEFTPRSIETEELRTRLVYEVRVFVTDPDDELRLGMPVTVDVLEERFDAPDAPGAGR